MFVLCFVVQCFESFLVLQSSIEKSAGCFTLFLLPVSCDCYFLWLFPMVPLIGLQCVIVLLPDHTRILFSAKIKQIQVFLPLGAYNKIQVKYLYFLLCLHKIFVSKVILIFSYV